MVSELVAILIVLALVVVAVGALLLLLVRRRFQARIAALKGQLGESPEFLDDRSYNQLRLAKAEAAALRAQGVDTRLADHAIADAESAGRKRDYDGALRSARLAHDLLVNLRTRAVPGVPTVAPLSLSMNDPGTSSPRAARPTADPSNPPPMADAGGGAGSDPPAPRLAKNRAESLFQIRLLNGEVERAAAERPSNAEVGEARAVSASAPAAYDRSDYTEALRIALRARRRLGATIESLPAPPTRIPPTPTAGIPPTSTPAGTVPCVGCGRPLQAADKFCRGCGTARAPTACPACGTALEAGDRFCAGCGAPVP